MSFFRRLLSPAGANRSRATRVTLLHGPTPESGDPFPIEVVGESHYQDELWAAVGSREPVDHRSQRVMAMLKHEPDNPYDGNAIAVLVETPGGYAQIGHLPRDLAAEYVADIKRLSQLGYQGGACDAVILGGFPDPRMLGGVASLGVRLHIDNPGAIVPLEDEEPRTLKSFEENNSALAAARSPLLSEVHSREIRSAGQALRTTDGMVRGRHYTEWVDDVASLKRHKAHEQCRALLGEIIDAAEAEAEHLGTSPPPWYYEQLAIVLRKMRNLDGEIEVLQRYLLFPHPGPNPRPELEDRLRKAIAKRG